MASEDKQESPKVEKLDSSEKLVSESKELEKNKEASENKKEAVEKVEDKKKVKSKPAVAKVNKKKGKDKKDVVELEREYVVPLRKGFLNVPHYRRAKKAVRVLKEFMVRHMNVRDGDIRKIKVDINLNNEIWFRGIKKPLNKVGVKAKKIGGIVYVSLSDPSDYVKFKMAREAKIRAAAEVGKKKDAKAAKKKVDADKDGVNDKKEESEDKKAGAEKAAKNAKIASKAVKHTAQGKHGQKTAPVRKVLK